MGKKTIRGTNPTFIQRRTLEKAKYDSKKFKFVKEVMKQDAVGALNKKSEKVKYYQFVNIDTGELVEIQAIV